MTALAAPISTNAPTTAARIVSGDLPGEDFGGEGSGDEDGRDARRER